MGKNDRIRAEYDFSAGVRGKHYRVMQAGYTITVRRANGGAVGRDVSKTRRAKPRRR